jgi:PTS system beta-glucosides-specific IIC component
VIVSPADGKIIPLGEVDDEVFSTGILGQGVAILPDNGEIYSPVDGVVATVAETKHAVTITADSGAQVLIHCGMDTVALRGEGFSLFVAAGERVMPGKLLLKFDPALICSRGYALTTPVVVVNEEEFELSIAEGERVRRGEPLIYLKPKQA